MDEATAVLVQKDTVEVLGASYVAIYDYATITGSGERKESDDNRNSHSLAGYVVSQIPNTPFFFLSKGQKYDLKERKVIKYQRIR